MPFYIFQHYMKCGNNEQCSKSEIQGENTIQERSKHGPLQILEVGAGVMFVSNLPRFKHCSYVEHALRIKIHVYRRGGYQ